MSYHHHQSPMAMPAALSQPPPPPPKVTSTRQPRRKKATAPREKGKQRSRNGCFSCKKLKIKCNEGKPACEYCIHTGRICLYPSDDPIKKNGAAKEKDTTLRSKSNSSEESILTRQTSTSTKSSSIASMNENEVEDEFLGRKIVFDFNISKDIANPYVLTLNSMKSQMHITRFEQKLLKFYLDFGGAFFTGNKNKETKRLFEGDAPRLWSSSKLMRNAIYAVSTMYLWRFYQLNHISNIYLSGDQYLVVYTNNDPRARSLFEITDEYIQNTFALLKDALLHIGLFRGQDEVGSVILANVFLFAVVSVHPVSGALVQACDGTSNYLADVIQVSSGIKNVAKVRSDVIQGSAYEGLLYLNELAMVPPHGVKSAFPFIESLREYLLSVHSPFEVTYMAVVDEIDAACFRALRFGYVIPILRAILAVSAYEDYIALLRAKDYVAMKIMYYYCCVVSICGIKMFSEQSIWDSFVEEFASWTETNLGGFETEFDAVMYKHVHERIADAYKRRGKPFLDPVQITLIGSGQPLDSKMGIGIDNR